MPKEISKQNIQVLQHTVVNNATSTIQQKYQEISMSDHDVVCGMSSENKAASHVVLLTYQTIHVWIEKHSTQK